MLTIQFTSKHLLLTLFQQTLKSTRELISSTNYILGAYTPLTKEGNILVDDVLASCYASTHHDLAHIGMTPMRIFPSIMEWTFGQDDGSSVYIKLNEEFAKFLTPFVIELI